MKWRETAKTWTRKMKKLDPSAHRIIGSLTEERDAGRAGGGSGRAGEGRKTDGGTGGRGVSYREGDEKGRVKPVRPKTLGV